MTKNRVEAFSDGVIAILITIMVLELKVPQEHEWSDLRPLVPVVLSYALSFVYLGIYWLNHHHLLHTIRAVTGGILWANLHLLFWLSLVPFATAWLGEDHGSAAASTLYGVVLLLSAVSYYILQNVIVRTHGAGSALGRAIGRDRKGKLSLVLNAVAIPLASVSPGAAMTLYVTVALMWFIPDRRIERALQGEA